MPRKLPTNTVLEEMATVDLTGRNWGAIKNPPAGEIANGYAVNDGWIRDDKGYCPVCGYLNAIGKNDGVHFNSASSAWAEYKGTKSYSVSREVYDVMNAADLKKHPLRARLKQILGMNRRKKNESR